MRVWLDDERPMPSDYDTHVKTASDAIDLLNTGVVTHISLDHDLGEPSAGTGYDVACAIEKLVRSGKIAMPTWRLHTANPVGRERMKTALNMAEYFRSHDNHNQ